MGTAYAAGSRGGSQGDLEEILGERGLLSEKDEPLSKEQGL